MDKQSNDIYNVLLSAAELFKTKNEQYGSAYDKHGKIMAALFPDGVKLQTAEDFNMFALIDLLVVKMNRMSVGFINKDYHVMSESLIDNLVYSAMAESEVNNYCSQKNQEQGESQP